MREGEKEGGKQGPSKCEISENMHAQKKLGRSHYNAGDYEEFFLE